MICQNHAMGSKSCQGIQSLGLNKPYCGIWTQISIILKKKKSYYRITNILKPQIQI